MMAAKNEQYDVVLANGRVIDPETYLDGTFNVGIKGDRIAAISDQPLKGKEVIDVSGMIVSPGFVDTHAHGMNVPSNRIQAFDGLTTALELEAGILPVGEFYDNCAKEGRPINYGVSSGWGYGRLVTMNPEVAIDGKPQPRLPFLFDKFALKEWTMNVATDKEWTMNVSTDKEFKQILAWTEQGIKEGGIGIGVIHGYAPGTGPKELLAVWQLAKQYNVPTYTHIQHVSIVDPESSAARLDGGPRKQRAEHDPAHGHGRRHRRPHPRLPLEQHQCARHPHDPRHRPECAGRRTQGNDRSLRLRRRQLGHRGGGV
jgi:N-acyl-D-glutamate deacylase